MNIVKQPNGLTLLGQVWFDSELEENKNAEWVCRGCFADAYWKDINGNTHTVQHWYEHDMLCRFSGNN